MYVILLILFLTPVYAVNGYPDSTLTITYDKGIQIQNGHCFPVVVSWEGKILEVAAMKKLTLLEPSWKEWKWLPGSLGPALAKTVAHPLHNKKAVDHGPNSLTHEGYSAYDFSVPQGTPVLAMEAGIVVRINHHFTEAHLDRERMNDVNTIEVVHADGTYAVYAHLKEKSAKVTLCQKVTAGDELALSGHTGYSHGPHLHVAIWRPQSGVKAQSVDLVFK